MMLRLARAALPALCLCLPSLGMAADRIPVEDFARHAELMTPRLSPDGQYLAMRLDNNENGNHALVIFKISDMHTPVSMLRMPKYELPLDIEWVSPTRLIVQKGKASGSLDIPEYTGEILATDIDGKKQDYLYGYEASTGSRGDTRSRDRGWGFVAGMPDTANGHFYLSENLWNNDNLSSLYDIDAVKNTRKLVGDIDVGNMSFFVGDDGLAHFAYGNNNKFEYVVYRRQANGWAKLDHSLTGRYFKPLALMPDRQHVYAAYSAEGGPDALVEQTENGGERKTLAQDGFASISDIQYTARPFQPFAITLGAGVPRPIYTLPDQPAAKLHMALSQKFPGEIVQFINFSEDGKELLFSVSSDRDPGSYFLIDTSSYKVIRLFAAEPWVDPAKMSERRPLRFKARDGQELEAILTIPRGAQEVNLPMVLLPHGGPFGIRDDWSYDDLSQFLASRGYLVLQVNYRGSGGRGVHFEHSGYQQWGGKIQDDLIDGVKWAISENYADPKRICIFGGSFGGYSALMAPVRAPGMFKCAIGYAGVYDLKTFYAYKKQESDALHSFFDSTLGTDPAQLTANSPVTYADKLDLPILLVHGEDDQNVHFSQAKEMRAALDAAHKSYEWLSKPGEGHGFFDEKNNVELYNKIQAFLAKNIGEGAPTAP